MDKDPVGLFCIEPNDCSLARTTFLWPDEDVFDGVIYDYDAPLLSELVNDYFKFRGYKEPSAFEALLFLITEVGELVEAMAQKYPEAINAIGKDARGAFSHVLTARLCAESAVAKSEGWVRNNPDAPQKEDPAAEGGDVLMMLVKTLSRIDADPLREMVAKWKSKGWEGA